MDTPDSPKPESEPRSRIIVDEDWKSQVEAEREAAAKQPPPSSAHRPAEGELPLPEASFSVLATTLATQAMMALGQGAAPDQPEVTVNLPFAKHCIDTLAVLEEKTKGNLTSEEEQLLAHFLYELRLLFVAVQQHVAQQPKSSPLEL